MCSPLPRRDDVGGRSRFIRMWQWIAFLLVLSVGSIWLMFDTGFYFVGELETFLRSHPILAPVLFVVAHIVAAIAFLPCSPFTLVAGLIWPLPLALPLSIVAALSASCATFLIGRYFQPVILRSSTGNSPLRNILAFSSKHGWRSVALTFINPVLPSATLGYAFGVSSISLRIYLWSALVAMLPLQVALVAMGGAVRQALMFKLWLTSGALLFVAAVGFGIWAMSKRGGRMADKRREDDESHR